MAESYTNSSLYGTTKIATLVATKEVVRVREKHQYQHLRRNARGVDCDVHKCIVRLLPNPTAPRRCVGGASERSRQDRLLL